jgi:hypothetical protein
LSQIETAAVKALLMTNLPEEYQASMDIRILVVLAAAALGAFIFVKARILFGGLDRAQLDERRRRQRMFQELEDRAPS